MKLILASASPRRKGLLEMLGLRDFAIVPARGEEKTEAGLSPAETVCALSLQKAREVAESAGIKFSGLSAHTPLCKPEISVEYLKQAIRWAADAGAPVVRAALTKIGATTNAPAGWREALGAAPEGVAAMTVGTFELSAQAPGGGQAIQCGADLVQGHALGQPQGEAAPQGGGEARGEEQDVARGDPQGLALREEGVLGRVERAGQRDEVGGPVALEDRTVGGVTGTR